MLTLTDNVVPKQLERDIHADANGLVAMPVALELLTAATRACAPGYSPPEEDQ